MCDKKAISEQEKCEPVAWLNKKIPHMAVLIKPADGGGWFPVFTHPAPVPADQKIVELVRLQNHALKTAVLTDPVYEALEAFNKWEGE